MMRYVRTDEMITEAWLTEFNENYQNTIPKMNQELVNTFVRAQSLPGPIAACEMKNKLIEKYNEHWKGKLSTHIKLLEAAYEYALNTTELSMVTMTPEQMQEQKLQLAEQIDATNVSQVQKMEKELEQAWFEADEAEYMKNYHFENATFHSEHYCGSAPTKIEINYLRSCKML